MSTKTSLLKRVARIAVVGLIGGLLSTSIAPVANASPNVASIGATCVARAGVGGFINVTYSAGDGLGVLRAVQTAKTDAAGASYTLQTNVIGNAYLESATTSASIQLAADTVTTSAATITYLVWVDYSAGNGAAGSTSAPDAVYDATKSVTCTMAGAPASFTLSASSASIAAGESSTFTVTPKDAAGNTTILAASNESFTVSGRQTSSTTGRLNIVSGLPTNTGKTVFASGRSIGQGAAASGVAAGANIPDTLVSQTSYNTGFTAAAAPSVGVDHRGADAYSSFLGSTPGLDGKDPGVVESATSTGAYSFTVSATEAVAATFTVTGRGLIAGATAATFSLTTQSFTYPARISFGSSTAVAAKGIGIVKGNQTSAESTGVATCALATPCLGTAPTTGTAYWLSTATGKTINMKFHTSSDATFPVTVSATTGVTLPAGITAATTNLTSVGNGTETAATLTLAATSPVAGQGYTVSFNSAANTAVTLTFVYEAPMVSSTRGGATYAPAAATTYKNVVSGTNSIEATVTDQFRDPFSGAQVIGVISGRNAQTLTSTTDANGVATITWTDAGAVLTGSGVTGTTDGASVTAQAPSSSSATTAASYTITYSSTLTAGSISVSNNSATAGTAVDVAVSFTATVLDASGLALSGYPVVFTGNANTFFSTRSNTTTAYTGTNGQVSVSFEGKTIGTGTITATSGGKSATSSYTILAGGARTVAVDAASVSMAPGESKRVTATVKDSYGNAVDGQSLTVTYVGTAGRVASVNGVSAGTGTTDTAGKVVIEISSDVAGTGTLTVAFTGGSTATTTNDDGTARPTRVASITSAITIAGKNATTTAVEAAQAAADAATDAALEAIDAANAATDAANLAAEAADAATVAAEEARDAADAATAAVEALATEVATLMSALKAQITTLANTVAKIARKVKA
jgi:hypothetical protein